MINLITIDGLKIRVNPRHIQFYNGSKMDGVECTAVVMSHGHTLYVKETPKEIDVKLSINNPEFRSVSELIFGSRRDR